MQTFLPYRSYAESARVLDNKRLGKQRVEAWQIFNILRARAIDKTLAWRNHPIVLAWEPYKPNLLTYGRFMCREWARRGFVDNMGGKFARAWHHYGYDHAPNSVLVKPHWLTPEVEAAYQSLLVWKDSKHYSLLFQGDVRPVSHFNWKLIFPDYVPGNILSTTKLAS